MVCNYGACSILQQAFLSFTLLKQTGSVRIELVSNICLLVPCSQDKNDNCMQMGESRKVTASSTAMNTS